MDVLVGALESAFVTAYKESYCTEQEVNLRVDAGISPPSRDLRVFRVLSVRDTVANPHAEITMEDARKIDPNAVMGQTVEELLAPKDFERIGRIVALTAKQVIMQHIRDKRSDT